ncbi:hypothetical protein P5V62_19370, partial [Mycobacteroides abscessus subsp. massiliense]|nr:hypothetical protein [Mycobacteroides abscessus subsp. massiliense]
MAVSRLAEARERRASRGLCGLRGGLRLKKAEDYLTTDFSLIVPPYYARFLELKADLNGNYRTRIKKDRPALYQFLLAVRLSAVSASGNNSAEPQD